MGEKPRNYLERRADEEGLDISEFRIEDLDYVEGRKKLDFKYQFSSGETLTATENKDGEARFCILKNGKEVFNFKDLVPPNLSLKFVTPSYWLKVNESNGLAPIDLLRDPKKFEEEALGQWGCDGRFISIGEIKSPKDIFALLHEIGHAKRIFEEKAEKAEARYEGDKKRMVESQSKYERLSSAEALKMVRKINNDLGVDLLEGFSDLNDLKKYIYIPLSTQRYEAEFNLSSMPTEFLKSLVIDGLKIDPKSKNYKWLDKLFDKRKLIKH